MLQSKVMDRPFNLMSGVLTNLVRRQLGNAIALAEKKMEGANCTGCLKSKYTL